MSEPYPHEPLPEDEYTVEGGGVTLRFVRKQGSPNLNFFEVFIARKNIGYLSQPIFSPKWFALTSFPEDAKGVFETFPEGQAFFYWKIFEEAK